ncbi:MAG: hypothetical protein ABFD66_08685 [Smithella sp.]
MTDRRDETQLLEPGLLGRWITANPNMWQMDLLDAGKFAWFLREKGIEGFHEEDIRLLWKLRLLRADLVMSSRKIRSADLIELEMDNQNRYRYADERRPRRHKRGLGNSAIALKAPEHWLQPYFHPFRYYVMNHIDRILKLSVGPMQMLRASYFPEVIEVLISCFNRWSSNPDALGRIDHWNNVAALLIATEPCAYEKVFYSLKYYPPFMDLETQHERIGQHCTNIIRNYREIGIVKIERIHQDLCADAEMLDPNKHLHMMIRLMKAESRRKMKGKLGGCILLLTMAEMLRRIAEDAFNIELPEEDEKGFGWTPRDFKKKVYGSHRILDRDRRIANEFMRQFGLDYSVRVRCYVEGDTEYGALESVFERYGSIELVNLAGSVVQKRGRGVAFRESLRSDLDKGIFSVIVIDGDRIDNVRAVRKAAEDDEICGMFFILEPDFEFANFRRSELEEILWNMLKEKEVNDVGSRQKLKEVIAGIDSGEKLLTATRESFPVLDHLDKGKHWGRILMDYAWKDPEILNEQTKKKKDRSIIEIVKIVVRSVRANYQSSRYKYKIDPKTGRPVPR